MPNSYTSALTRGGWRRLLALSLHLFVAGVVSLAYLTAAAAGDEGNIGAGLLLLFAVPLSAPWSLIAILLEDSAARDGLIALGALLNVALVARAYPVGAATPPEAPEG